MGSHIWFRWWFTTRHRNTLLLLAIFSFAALFRVAIIFHNEYPPSSDIGLHGSIINLILDQGTLPTWNPYHMGGETLATPPGFHFFVATLILLTGMPLILAELATAAFYSSAIVFPAYLVSRKIWRSHSAGIIAAFFAAVSALSLEMISWGGYTNIISLFLIIVIFYLFLRDIDQPIRRHLLVGTLLFGSLILIHTFSLFVFFPILGLYFLLLLARKFLKHENMELLKKLRFFVVSIALGAVAISPWLLRVLSFYIGASAEGALTGGLDNKDIILANRTVDPIITALIIVVIPALFMLRASRKKYFDSNSLLLVAWFLVPVIMTQAYLFGVYTDYSRFMYFIDFPGIVIISAGLFYLFRYTSIAVRVPRIKGWNRIKKTVPASIFVASIFIFIILSPWSIFPDEAMERANFYTTIHQPEANALNWIKTNTPENAVLVADHLYGWWLSGIGERTTLSAAGLEFLIYAHELEVAKSAQLLLDTNYYIDNGLIQIRDDGPHILRHNPSFSIETGIEESYSLFNFQDNGTQLYYYCINNYGGRDYANTTLADMKLTEAPILVQDENSANLTITRENDLFRIDKILTVWQGSRFAEMSYNVTVKSVRTTLYNIWLPIYTIKGYVTIDPWTPLVGIYESAHKVCGQIIFQEDLPAEIHYVEAGPTRIEMLYRHPLKQNINIKMLVGVYDSENRTYHVQLNERYAELATNPLEKVTQDPLITWNYVDMMKEYDVSYVVCRDYRIYSKFSEDPQFRLMFNAGNVTVFQAVK
jgi:hypothetical protein